MKKKSDNLISVFKKETLKELRDLDGHLKFDRGTVSKEMTKQAVLYFRYARMYNDAYRISKACRQKKEDTEARMYRELGQSENRITERMLDVACRKDNDWLAHNRRCMQIEHVVRQLESACRALEHRRDMLINLGATMRAEIGSETSIRK